MNDTVVLDASAILAVLYEERGGELVLELMSVRDTQILVSAVNLCEVMTKLALDGGSSSQVARNVKPFRHYFVEFDAEQATRAAEMVRSTRPFGLSLGDRACLALAASRNAVAWTTDAAWTRIDHDLEVRLIRS